MTSITTSSSPDYRERQIKRFRKFEDTIGIWLDAFYKKRGATKVVRIEGPANKDYDKLVTRPDRIWKVEEKARSWIWNDLLVEIIQDTATDAPGWIYTSRCDVIVYAMARGLQAVKPEKVWVIKFNPLKEFVLKHLDKFPDRISDKGWGTTLNKCIPWYTIEANKLGYRAY